jgi:opacity protein-like surface antigen
MKTSIRFSLLTLCISAACATAHARHYVVRASAMHLSYTDDNFTSEEGFSVAAGLTLDTNRSHELAVEIGRTDWSFSAPLYVFNNTQFKTTGEGEATIAHASYRYHFLSSTARLRPYIGASLGAAKLSGDIERKLSGVWYSGTIDDWTFSGAASAGVAIRINDHLSAELGYRYLQIDGTDIQTTHHFSNIPGAVIAIEDLKAHVLTAGIAFRF